MRVLACAVSEVLCTFFISPVMTMMGVFVCGGVFRAGDYGRLKRGRKRVNCMPKVGALVAAL